MSALAPRRCAFRGTVPAQALWFGGLPEDLARERVLQAWRPGCQVLRLGEGLLLRLPKPARLPAEESPGAPLLEIDGALWAFPPSSSELSALAPRPNQVVLAHAGLAQVLPLPSEAVDPSDWITETGALLSLQSLGAPPEPVKVQVVAAPGRERFGVPPAHPDQAAALAQLKGEAPVSVSRAAGWLARFMRWLGKPRDGAPRPQAGAGSRGPSTALTPRSSLFQRLLLQLDQLALAGLMQRALGARHGRYVQELMEKLEQGDLNEALRRAIPLDEQGKADPKAGPSFTLPSARQELKVGPGSTGGSATGLESEVFQRLRELYTRAAEKLEAEGRLEEAAFTLAELLGRATDAVAMLERHRRFELAADIAEARSLVPAWQVALRMKAGQPDRAVALALMHGAFADAWLRLDKEGSPQARQLRRLKALRDLAEGYFHSAATLAGVIEDQALLQRVVQRALQAGDLQVLSLLAVVVKQCPQALPELIGRAQARLDDPSLPQDVLAQLIAALDTQGLEATLKPLPADAPWRAPLRRVMREAARQALASPHPNLRAGSEARLAALGSQALLQDMVGRSRTQPAPPGEPLVLPPTQRGAQPILDAALTAEDALILALGEAGVTLHIPGERVRHLEAPAERLVLSPGGQRALALARRGPVWRISPLDLASGEVLTPWELPLIDWAPQSHEGTWLTADERGLALLNLLSETPQALWRGGSGVVSALGDPAGPRRFAVMEGEQGAERWGWSPADGLLRSRDPLGERPWPEAMLALNTIGALLEAWCTQGEEGQAVLCLRTMPAPVGSQEPRWTEQPVVPLPQMAERRPMQMLLGTEQVWVLLHGPEGLALICLALAPKRVCIHALLPGASDGRMRQHRQGLLLSDNLGRVTLLDPKTLRMIWTRLA